MKKYWKHSVAEGKTEYLGLADIDSAEDLRNIVKNGLPFKMVIEYGVSRVYKGNSNQGPDVYVRATGRIQSQNKAMRYPAVLNYTFKIPLKGMLELDLTFLDKDGKKVEVRITCKDNSKVVKIYIV